VECNKVSHSTIKKGLKMSNYICIKRRTTDAAVPSINTLKHNQRLQVKIDYLLPKFQRKRNYHFVKIENAEDAFSRLKKANETRYQNINKRKLRSDANRLESLLIILSEEQVNRCNPDDIWRKAIEFKSFFEEKYQTTVNFLDWHRDEGHDGHINNHVHLEYDNVSRAGKMVRRTFTKWDLVKMQDTIAEIFSELGFKRGENTVKETRFSTPKRGYGQEKFRNIKKRESKLELKIKQAQNKSKNIISSLLEEQTLLQHKLSEKEKLNEELKADLETANKERSELYKLAYYFDIAYSQKTCGAIKVRCTYKTAYKTALFLRDRLADSNSELIDWKSKASALILKMFARRHKRRVTPIQSTLSSSDFYASIQGLGYKLG